MADFQNLSLIKGDHVSGARFAGKETHFPKKVALRKDSEPSIY